MNSELEKYIEESLTKGVDLSPGEYKAQCEKADATAENNGVEGSAPIDEETRHKRIQCNFYGTILNFLASILCEVSETNRMLAAILGKGVDDGRR